MPPASMERRIWILSSIGGWVENSPLERFSNFLMGLAMYRWAVARLAASRTSLSPLIFCSASARPLGLRVSLTAVASARNSRWRLMESCRRRANRGARMASTMAMSIMMSCNWLPPSPPPRPPPLPPPNQRPRRKKSEIRTVVPTRTPTSIVADIEVADVGHLVGDDALQLVAVQLLQEA